MNRRIRRLNARLSDLIDMVNNPARPISNVHVHDDMFRLATLISWLTDDHRARAARRALDGRSLPASHPRVTPDGWCEGVPYTHNASLQNWRRFYVQTPRLPPISGLIEAATTQKAPLDLVQRLIKDNLTCSR